MIFNYTRNGDLESIKKMVESDITVIKKVNQNGSTPLISAVCNLRYGRYERLDVVKYLITVGSDVNFRNKFGKTPLYKVIEFDSCLKCEYTSTVIELLIEHGADPYIKDINGKTPIDICNDKEEMLNYIRLTKLNKLYKNE